MLLQLDANENTPKAAREDSDCLLLKCPPGAFFMYLHLRLIPGEHKIYGDRADRSGDQFIQ